MVDGCVIAGTEGGQLTGPLRIIAFFTFIYCKLFLVYLAVDRSIESTTYHCHLQGSTTLKKIILLDIREVILYLSAV